MILFSLFNYHKNHRHPKHSLPNRIAQARTILRPPQAIPELQKKQFKTYKKISISNGKTRYRTHSHWP